MKTAIESLMICDGILLLFNSCVFFIPSPRFAQNIDVYFREYEGH